MVLLIPRTKNEWERYGRKRIADFLNWQVDIVNEYKRKDQFVTHCFMPAFHEIDQVESFRQMEYPAINPYHSCARWPERQVNIIFGRPHEDCC
ncbi:MAG: beta-galactosidase [Bacteroides cellulosilyticus]